MIRASVTTIATSHADDAAYLALHDVSRLTVGFDDVRVVGGQMASLLLHAYPVPGAAHRRTADADTAISTQIAASGEMHTRLLAAGYAAETGNHYVMPGIDEEDRHIDLLVPASGSAFTSEVVGDRGFDAAPGLGLALAAPPIVIDVEVALTNGILLEFSARVPPVELALVLKAYATQSRHATRDYVDLYNLLSIGYEYRDSPEAIGGWKIGRATTTGARRDAASILNGIADRSRAVSELDDTAISRERFVAMVRSLIPNPSQAP